MEILDNIRSEIEVNMEAFTQNPPVTEINIVISCGVQDGNKGIWGERYRVPFDEVYHKV